MIQYAKMLVCRMLMMGLFVVAVVVTLQFITGFSSYDLVSWVMN